MTDVEIRKPVALRTLHGIELAALGTWKASTGITTFTEEDFVNAVAALECPGVRNPVIKLGHQEPDSDSGVRWDGEPAVGWIANMRFDGAKLIGDLTGVPAWLADADENGLSVMAAAYPDRSIEISRPFECQIGHLHPSVITALSLLGVVPPGIGVLKSMQDVYAAFTEPAPATLSRAMLSTTVTLAAAEQRELTDVEKRSGVDFDQHAEQWSTAVDDLVDNWADIDEAQRAELAAQITTAVDENPDMLGDMTVDSAAAAALLLASMTTLAGQAAAGQVASAKRQGVTLTEPDITEADVQEIADAVAAAMAASTASTAGRTAAQLLGTGTGAHVSAETISYMAGLTDRFLRDQLGGALSHAQHIGRMAVLSGYEGSVDLYASEIADTNACAPCRSIDGTRFEDLDSADAAYGSGKYSGCAGGARCRGQLIAVFGSDRASARTIATTLGGRMGVTKASVSVEDISRQYYETAGYSMYITAMHVDPLELIASDDSTGKFYRIGVELGAGDKFTFSEPQEVAIAYQDVKAAAAAMPVRFADRTAALLAAGKNADGSDLVAKDVTPAGAAIRKAMGKTTAEAATVLDTEVTTETPDADEATGPTTTPKEASVDAAKMREALGLAPEATEDEVREAFAAQLSSPVTPPAPTGADIDAMATLAASGQAVLVDRGQLTQLIETAKKGEIAYNQNRANERNAFLSTAVREGRIPPASLKAYEKLWDNDPEGTRKTVSLLARNIIPTSASGLAGQEVDMNEAEQVYAAMYGTGA